MTKLQTPLSKAAAAGKIDAKGKTVPAKKITVTKKSESIEGDTPAKKTVPAKKSDVPEIAKKSTTKSLKPTPKSNEEKSEDTKKSTPKKSTVVSDGKPKSRNAMICEMLLSRKFSDGEIKAAVEAAFPGRPTFITSSRADINAGKMYADRAEGKLPLLPLYRDAAGKLVTEKPKAKSEKQPVKKAAMLSINKAKNSLPE